MRNWLVLALACSVVAIPGQASLIEDNTSTVHPALVYQHDAHVNGDAPGTCLELDERRVADPGVEVPGLLVDIDDEQDVFKAAVGTQQVGSRATLDLDLGAAVAAFEVSIEVFDADCGFSVLDPEAPIYDEPETAPELSFEAGPGEQIVAVESLEPTECNATEWKVQLKVEQGSVGPSLIYMEWTDGSWEYVSLHHASQGTVSMYLHNDNLEFSLAKVEAVVSDAWDGRFKIAHGPCDLPEGTPPTAPDDPYSSGTYAEWEITPTSHYVIQVTLTKGAADTAEETAEFGVATATGLLEDPSMSVPVNCHYVCTSAISEVSYNFVFDAVAE